VYKPQFFFTFIIDKGVHDTPQCCDRAKNVLSFDGHLRTSMTQGRLVNLAIMSTESDILREIDFTATISDFAVAKSRNVSGL